MVILGGILCPRFCRFRDFQQIVKLGRNVEFYKNGLPISCVGVQRYKNFCLYQQNMPESKALTTEPTNKISFKNESKEDRNEIITLPSEKSVKTVFDALQSIPLKSHVIMISLKWFVWITLRKKLTNDKSEIQSIHKNPHFIELCRLLEKNFTMCTPLELFTLFQFALIFKIPQSSLFVNKIFALLLDNVNVMPLVDLMGIYIKLDRFEETTAVKALKTSIYLCLEYKQYPDVIDFKSACYFFSKGVFPKNVVNKLLEIIKGNCDAEWSPLIWSQVAKGLEKTHSKDLFEKDSFLLEKLSKLVYEVNESWPTLELSKTCNSLIATTRNVRSLYNESLLDVLARNMSLGNRDLREVCVTLFQFCRLYHFNYSLYQDFCKRFRREWLDKLNRIPMGTILKIVHIFAATNFLELDEETVSIVKEHFKSIDFAEDYRNSKRSIMNLLNLILDLISIDIYDKNLVDLFFHKLTSEIDFEKITKYEAFFINILCQYVSIFHPEDYKPLPDGSRDGLKDLVSQCSETGKEMERMFDKDLSLVTECVTPEGLFFSHAVVFQPDNTPSDLSFMSSSNGFPVEISSETFPAGSKIIFFNFLIKELVLEFLNVSLETPWVRVLNKIYKHLNYDVYSLSMTKISDQPLESSYLIKDFVNKQLQINK